MLYADEVLVETKSLKGKFKNGYFNIKRKVDADFRWGPLWTIGGKKMLLGLTGENQLVLLSSTNNTVFLVVIPIGGSGEKNVVSYFNHDK